MEIIICRILGLPESPKHAEFYFWFTPRVQKTVLVTQSFFMSFGSLWPAARCNSRAFRAYQIYNSRFFVSKLFVVDWCPRCFLYARCLCLYVVCMFLSSFGLDFVIFLGGVGLLAVCRASQTYPMVDQHRSNNGLLVFYCSANDHE